MAALTGLGVLFNLLVAVVSARVLGPAGRGVVALAITIGTTTCIVFSFGINIAGRYYLPRKDDEVRLGHYHGLGLLLTVLQTGASVILAELLLGNRYDSASTVGLIGVYSALSLLTYFEQDALNAFGLLLTSSALSAAGSLIQVLGIALVIGVGHLTIGSTIGVLDVGMTCQLLVNLGLLRSAGHDIRPRASRAAYAALLRKGTPALGMNAAQSLTFRFDRYVVAGVLGMAPLGIYSVAVAGSEVLRILPAAWGQIAFYRVASGQVTVHELQRQRRGMLLAMVPLLIGWALVTPVIVHLVFGPAYEAAVTPWRLLMLGEVGVMAYQIDSCLLAASGRTIAAGVAGTIGLFVVIPLDLILIPMRGLDGAGAASALAYLVMGGVATLMLHRMRPNGGPDHLGTTFPVDVSEL